MRLFSVFLLSLVGVALPCQLHPQERDPREFFSRAYALYSQGQLSQAQELFLQTLDRAFPLEDYSLYFLGLTSLSLGEFEKSRSYFSRLKQLFPTSVWSSRADLELARLSLAEAKYQQAAAQLRTLRSPKIKKEISDEALYLLALTHETLGELKRAYSLYQELRRTSPLTPWAAAASKNVSALREKQPDLLALERVDDLVEEGEILLREREYQEAERIYRRLLDLVPKGILRPRFLFSLTAVYQAARKREEAIPVLAEILQEHPSSREAPNALYRLAMIYWNRDDNAKALDYFTQLRARYPASPFLDLAQIASARIYESLGRPQEALRLYRGFSSMFPDSPLRAEARWRLAWIHYSQRNYERARAALQRLATDRDATAYKTQALYWQARAAQKMGRAEEAKQLLLQLLNLQEESYYKGPAARWLQEMGVDYEETKAARSSAPIKEVVPSLNSDFVFHLARARVLAGISLGQLAVAELDEIRSATGDDLAMKLTLMREYARNGAYGRSVALANQLAAASDEMSRYRYPLAFWETIQKLAQERDLDPYLVLGLIRQESVFDPKALSPASAFGLMQLLPSTASRMAAKLGLPAPQPEKLYEPELNLALGTHYLKELLLRYSNNPVKALAAYNAGEAAVARWEKQIAAEDEEEFIERIPYRETRLYVKLVLRNHRLYRKIYSDQK